MQGTIERAVAVANAGNNIIIRDIRTDTRRWRILDARSWRPAEVAMHMTLRTSKMCSLNCN